MKESKTPYYTDPDIKQQIDKAMHQACLIFTQLGKSSSKEELTLAKHNEYRILKSVRHLDPEFVDIMLRND